MPSIVKGRLSVEEMTLLQSLREAGASIHAIQLAMPHKTYASLVGWLFRMGLSSRYVSQRERKILLYDVLARLIRDNEQVSSRIVQRETGWGSLSTVNRYMNKLITLGVVKVEMKHGKIDYGSITLGDRRAMIEGLKNIEALKL